LREPLFFISVKALEKFVVGNFLVSMPHMRAPLANSLKMPIVHISPLFYVSLNVYHRKVGPRVFSFFASIDI
jgi:hypothetical protein